MVCSSPLRMGLDAATLGRAAAVVRDGGDVGDGADLEANRAERTDCGFPAGAGSLDEHVDALHTVLHRAATGSLGCHLRGEGGRLAGALEADGAGGGPRDDRAGGVGAGDHRVVERALDVGMSGDDILLLFATHLAGAGVTTCSSHKSGFLLEFWFHSRQAIARRLLGLLLTGDGLAGALATAGVGARALTTYREAAAVA